MKSINLIIILLLTVSLFSETSLLTIKEMRSSSFEDSVFKVESVYDENSNYKVDDISFSVNGIKQYALMSTPKLTKPNGGYPVIILIHGHIPPKQYSTFNSYKYMFSRFANSEFVTIKPDLRGHGRSESGDDFDMNLSKLHYTQDILGLIDALKKNQDIDYNNIFVLGHSNGGDITLRLITARPNLIKAATLWAPVSVKIEESNFFYKGRGRNKYGHGAVTDPMAKDDILQIGKKLDVSLKNAGINSREDIRYYNYLNEIKTPMIFRHPDTDESVPYAWSLAFIKKYNESGNKQPVELINYPGDNHNIAKHQREAQMDDLKWFRTFIK